MIFKKLRNEMLEASRKAPKNTYVGIRYNANKKIEYMTNTGKWTESLNEASLMSFNLAFANCTNDNSLNSYICFGSRVYKDENMFDVLKKHGALFMPLDEYLKEISNVLEEALK